LELNYRPILTEIIMKKLLLLLLIGLNVQYGFSQARDFDEFKVMFLKRNGFAKETLTNYYANLMEFNLTAPESKGIKRGFLHANGTVFKEAEFDFASDFVGGKSNIVKNKICGLLFANGTEKYFPKLELTYFTEGNVGLAIKDKKYGFVNLEGEMIIPFAYEDAFPFYEGIAAVKSNERWFYINEKGEKLLSDSLLTGYQPANSAKAIIYNKTKAALSNKLGLILTSMVEYMNKVQKLGFKQKLYDIKKRTMLMETEFDEISGFYENGLMKVANEGKVGLVDQQNKIIIPIEYDEIGEISSELIIAKKGKWGVVNKRNEIIIPFQYNRIYQFHEGLAFVENENKVGYINKKNEKVIPSEFDFCWYGDFTEGLALVKQKDKFGFIDKTGKTIIPFLYDDALPFTNGSALVYDKASGKCFFINKKGENVLNIKYSYLWQERAGFIKFAN
jgi:hypothetical protein